MFLKTLPTFAKVSKSHGNSFQCPECDLIDIEMSVRDPKIIKTIKIYSKQQSKPLEVLAFYDKKVT